MDYTQAKQILAKAEKLETYQSVVFRFLYIILSAPFFQWVYDGGLNDAFGIDLFGSFYASTGLQVLFFIVCGGLFLLPLWLWYRIEYFQKKIDPFYQQFNIQFPKRYIPILIFWVYIVTLTFQISYPWFGWVVWIGTVIGFEWYFHQKVKSDQILESKFNNIK